MIDLLPNDVEAAQVEASEAECAQPDDARPSESIAVDVAADVAADPECGCGGPTRAGELCWCCLQQARGWF